MYAIRFSAGIVLATVCLYATPVRFAKAADAAAEGDLALPWQSPTDASTYITVSAERGKAKLINATTAEVATEEFPDLRSPHCYIIEGANGALLNVSYGDQRPWLDPLENLHLSSTGGILPNRSWAQSTVMVTGNNPKYFRPDPKVGYHVRENMRQAFWIEGGDVWIGDIDWIGGEVVNRQQVTHVGQFEFDPQKTRVQGRNAQHMVCWSGRNLLIEAGFDPQKPLVRINLDDGSVEELDWLVYEGKSIADEVGIDPGERVAVHTTEEGIRLIDLTSGKVLKVPWGEVAENGLNVLRKRPLGASDVAGLGQQNKWIDPNRLVLGFTIMSDASASNAFVVLDLSSGKLDIKPMQPLLVKGNRPNFGGNFDVIAGEHPAILVPLSFNVQGMNMMYGLVDIESGATQVPPGNPSLGNVNWAGPYHFVYSVSDQGLSGNGTYVLDRRTGQSVRLAQFPDFSYPRTIAAGKVIVFQQGDRSSPQAIYRVSPDGSDLKQVASSGRILTTFDDKPLAISIDSENSIAQVEPLPLFQSGVSDHGTFTSERDRLKQTLEDEPAEIQTFALNVYDQIAQNYVLANFFKRLDTTLAIVETRKTLGDRDFGTLIARTEATSDLIDVEKAKEYFQKKAMNLLRSRSEFTAEQKGKIASAAADRAARDLIESPTMGIDPINKMFMDALLAEQQAVREGSAESDAGTAAGNPGLTAQQQQPQSQMPSQQQQQEQPKEQTAAEEEEPSPVDKAQRTIDDASKAADKLRGLFR